MPHAGRGVTLQTTKQFGFLRRLTSVVMTSESSWSSKTLSSFLSSKHPTYSYMTMPSPTGAGVYMLGEAGAIVAATGFSVETGAGDGSATGFAVVGAMVGSGVGSGIGSTGSGVGSAVGEGVGSATGAGVGSGAESHPQVQG